MDRDSEGNGVIGYLAAAGAFFGTGAVIVKLIPAPSFLGAAVLERGRDREADCPGWFGLAR